MYSCSNFATTDFPQRLGAMIAADPHLYVVPQLG
jgi:hypothetical protein